ncbi:Hypothetical predicted protein [Olea europaea subsp. europaea]|uniref:BSD domain-containing protein n=1 Tax=Olea europaea subsp. europaea TaxID=158383 RepID=A0A8S0UQT5_OLEEU|nr:Hypothetical predicted protein [Olea europaea subsp. europaea]
MSWFARSISNMLKFDDNDDEVSTGNKPKPENVLQDDDVSSPISPSRGVKDDFSELTKTLKSQLWGVASFLAPQPQLDPNKSSREQDQDQDQDPDPDAISGIQTDLAEIGGRFRNGISKLSNNINVSEITKMASNFLQLESDDEIEKEGSAEDFNSARKKVVGVTEEVVTFASDIAMHPKTWLDFPLPENDDFDMSDAQQEHALAVEYLVPRLSALRFELCPGYMSESCFWKIYFVLLHPRLDKEDAEILSTSQIIKARSLLAQESKNQTPTKLKDFPEKGSSDPKDGTAPSHEDSLYASSFVPSENEHEKASALELSTSTIASASEIVKHPVESIKIPIVDKSVIEEEVIDQVKDQNLKSGPSKVLEAKDEEQDDGDDWLKEESSEIGGASGTTIPIENEDDVSFSDLEEDDGHVPASSRKTNYSFDKDSRDWLDVEEIDVS